MGHQYDKNKPKLSYERTEVHRVVQGMFVQMGKIECKDANNESLSIFPEGRFADESHHVNHEEVGLLGMCKD